MDMGPGNERWPAGGPPLGEQTVHGVKVQPARPGFEPGSLAGRIAEQVAAWRGQRTSFAVADLAAHGLTDPGAPEALHEAMTLVCAAGLARMVSPAPNSYWKIVSLAQPAAHPDFQLRGTVTGRLPRSGEPMQDIRFEGSRDYPADQDLCFRRGQYTDRIRVTEADREALRRALGLTDDGDVVQFLEERLARVRAAQELAFGEIGPGADVRALERVIALLRGAP